MEILPAIQQRRSVRAYTAQPVPETQLQAVLEAARLAPSARNLQAWRFIVVRAAATRARLAAAANRQAFVGQAPVVIAGCAVNTEYVMRGGQLAYPIDLAIALDHMTLQAAAAGLGTCWIGSFGRRGAPCPRHTRPGAGRLPADPGISRRRPAAEKPAAGGADHRP